MTDKNISDFSPVYVLAGSKFDYQLASPANSSKYVDVCVFSGISRGEGRKICKKGLLREAGGQFYSTSCWIRVFRYQRRCY